MSLQDSLTELLRPAVENEGFFLEQVLVSNPGNHRILTCVVDGTKPLNLDEVTVVSRLISEILDETTLIDDAFTLEVTSPGVDRPLTLERHWRRNLTRLVKVVLREGAPITGRIMSVQDGVVTLDVSGAIQEIAITDVAKARVEVEFNREEK